MEQDLLFKNYFLLDLDITPSIPRCRKNCASPAHCFFGTLRTGTAAHLLLVLFRNDWCEYSRAECTPSLPCQKSHPCRREGRRVGSLDQENQLSGITPLNAKIKAVHPERDSKKEKDLKYWYILKSPEIKHSFSGSSGRFWYKNQVASLQFKKKSMLFWGPQNFGMSFPRFAGFFFGASSCC